MHGSRMARRVLQAKLVAHPPGYHAADAGPKDLQLRPELRPEPEKPPGKSWESSTPSTHIFTILVPPG